MKISLAIDRFEGDARQVAILVDDRDRTIDFPRDLLPKGCRAGDVISMTLEKDEQATKRVADEAKRLQDELGATDPGGDISL
ncbi:MAG: DUF3006 domain-containing protein [Isosphaeraceae bacterium]